MIIAVLIAAAAPATAIDAERAFARDAQRLGQWTAFRKWADRDAVVFTPQARWARDALPKSNPRVAIRWWPAHSFVSCDGRTAVNTGPWVQPDSHGFFTTVWQKTEAGWRWAYDGGDVQPGHVPKPIKPQVHRSACSGKPPGAPIIPPPPLSAKQARSTPEDNGRGQSADRTLGWDWKVEKNGTRKFRLYQWDGRAYSQVLFNDIKPK